jgi:hypothetical protein
MGHSFGCVVVSSILGGPGGKGALPRPSHAVGLVQGAVSLWSWGDTVKDLHKPGYFNGVLGRHVVAGPIVTTRSVNDKAVGVAYPLAVGLVGQTDFAPDDLPLFGGIGTFGIQGTSIADDQPMLQATRDYRFVRGRIHNLESSDFIPSHSGIDGPEVAHAIWRAARAGSGAYVWGHHHARRERDTGTGSRADPVWCPRRHRRSPPLLNDADLDRIRPASTTAASGPDAEHQQSERPRGKASSLRKMPTDIKKKLTTSITGRRRSGDVLRIFEGKDGVKPGESAEGGCFDTASVSPPSF